MATTTQLGHVAFRVRDMERSKQWYGEALGAHEAFRGVDPDGTVRLIYVEFAPGQFIELFPGGSEPIAPNEGTLGYVHTCLVVDDLAATLAHLATLGVTPTAPPRAGRAAQQLAFINDTDGNQIELMEIPPTSTLYRAPR
jgi:lactoylglutathione lyase